MPEWFPDDFGFDVFDARVAAHFVGGLLNEHGGDGAGGAGESHVYFAETFFIDAYIINQSEVDDAEIELGVDDFVEFGPVFLCSL